MKILKEEINEIGSSLRELAKWKLVSVAAVSVVGLGWSDTKPENDGGLLLLYSVGFLCAYLDTLYYQSNTSIHILASYLRSYQGQNDNLLELKNYEEHANKYRNAEGLHFLSFRWPHFIYSLLFSAGLPVLAYMTYRPGVDSRLLLPALAVITNVVLFVLYSKDRDKLVVTDEQLKPKDSSKDPKRD